MASPIFPHSLLLWLVTVALLLGHTVSFNSHVQDNTNSTLDLSFSDSSTPTSSLRTKFDTVVSSWKQKNPILASQISDEAIDTVWQRISGNSSSSVSQKRTETTNYQQNRSHPLHKRQNATTSEILAARTTVADAQAQQAIINNQTLTNARRNVYTRNPSRSTTKNSNLTFSSPLMTSNPDLFNALATVAEADAAVLAQQGSLYKDYTLPGKYAKYNLPGTPTGSQNSKRQNTDPNDWWLPNAGVSATGSLPFGNYSSIFHNVLYCGAYGDGIHDDTAAINKCLNTACGEGCGSTSTRGSVVYFPPGTYLVSSPIIMEYNTQMIGNVLSLPVILAAPSFVGLGVISSDVYIPGGNGGEWYLDTDNFFRQVRNFVIDMTECTTPQVAGIHWQVAQATSLQNIEIVMDSSSTTTQVGIYSENGSGGFMSDILIAGGNIGLQCGNQQFTTRNFIFYNVIYGIWMIWDWGWTFKSITWDSVQHAIWMVSSTVGGSLHLLDSTMNSVTTNGIVMDNAVGSTMQEQVLITIDNLAVDSATIVVFDVNAGTFLSTSVADVIQSWVIGKQYDSYDPGGSWVNGATLQVLHPTTGSLMGGPNGGYFESSKPQYNSFITDNVLMANIIAVGDGETDDTASLSLIFEIGAALSQVVYIPTGSYIITSTLVVPVNSRISGSLWSQLVAKGDYFEDIESPQVMLQVGNAGDIGTLQLQDLLFTGVGPTAGAILVEWNVVASSPGTAGMWDCHFRVGGAVGTDLQVAQCPTTSTSAACIGAFLMFHVTSSGNGYFENVWAWSADHDMDDPNETQINVFTGRGTLIESPGPSWFYASASEHAVLYQYNLYSASSIYMGMIQSETPYYSPLNPSPGQFTQLASLTTDPDFSGCTNVSCEAAWALTITNSTSIQILGAGLYSWYNDGYSEACVDSENCQLSLVTVSYSGQIYIYNLYTIGSVNMITPGPSDFGITGIATAGSHPLSGIVTATDNLVENAHPFLSALNAWTSIDTSWIREIAPTANCPTNTNELCCILDGNQSFLASESSARGIAQFFESWIDRNGAIDLVGKLWQNAPQSYTENEVDCQEIGGTCDPPFDCGTVWEPVGDLSYYWAMSTLSIFFDSMNWWSELFLGQQGNMTDYLNLIVDDFPVQVPLLPSASTILGDLGGLLGIVGSLVAINPAFEEGATASSVISGLGGMFSLIGGNIAPSDNDQTDPAAVLGVRIGQVFGNANTAVKDLLSGIMANGDISAIPSQYTDGIYASPIANFFDNGNYLWLMSPEQEEAISTPVTQYMQKNIIGYLLGADNWWILQDAYTLDDCPTISSGTVLNGHCYSLESYGTGYTATTDDFRHNTYSVPAGNDTLTSLAKYNITLDDLYLSSNSCQAGNSYYGGSITLDFADIVSTGRQTIPPCFYSLPVFYVSPEEDIDNTLFSNNLCNVLDNNKTATTPVAGLTFLPDNIASNMQYMYCCAVIIPKAGPLTYVCAG